MRPPPRSPNPAAGAQRGWSPRRRRSPSQRDGRVNLAIRPFSSPERQLELLPPLVEAERPAGSRTHAPVFDHHAAAGGLDDPGLPEQLGYVDTGRRITRADFALHVLGHSMEPLIRSGSLCLFRKDEFGEHLDGQIVLAQGREEFDSEEGARLTVKRLRIVGPRQVELVPSNPSYPTIQVRPGRDLRVLATYRRMLVAWSGGISRASSDSASGWPCGAFAGISCSWRRASGRQRLRGRALLVVPGAGRCGATGTLRGPLQCSCRTRLAVPA